MTTDGNGGQAQGAPASTQQQAQGAAVQQDQQQAPGTPGQGPTAQEQAAVQGIDPATIQDPAVRAWVEQTQRRVHELSQEAARYRTERNTLQEQVQQTQRQQETEQQRIQREAQEAAQERDALREQVRDLTIGAAFREAATAAGAFSPEAVQALAQARGLTVETDQAGKPTNVAAILDALRTSDPYLFRRTPGADAGAGGTAPAATSSINDLIRGKARQPAR